jgi:hypothetical protein
MEDAKAAVGRLVKFAKGRFVDAPIAVRPEHQCGHP